MRTLLYEPTPAWEHALVQPHCKCHLLLVATHNARVVGWCRAFPEPQTKRAEIGLGLLSGYRDQRVGSSFIAATLAWAKGQGLENLTLRTRHDNMQAIYLFQKFGFEQSGEVEKHGWLRMVYIL